MSHYSTAQSLTPLPVVMLLCTETKRKRNAASPNSRRRHSSASTAKSFEFQQEQLNQLRTGWRWAEGMQILSCLTVSTSSKNSLGVFGDCKNEKITGLRMLVIHQSELTLKENLCLFYEILC